MPDGSGDQCELAARLRAVIEATDAENAALRAELAAQRERYRRLELRVAELERREDRRRGSQPGYPGAGLSRYPDPDERAEVPPPAECSRCGTVLDGAERAGTWWSQVRDVRIATFVTGYLLPLLACPCGGAVNAARPPPSAYPGSVSYGPGINTAAVLLSSYGNVPAERAANLIGMLLGVPVSPGFVDLASGRLSSRLEDAGFDEAMQAAPLVPHPQLHGLRRQSWPDRTRCHHPRASRQPLAAGPNRGIKPQLATTPEWTPEIGGATPRRCCRLPAPGFRGRQEAHDFSSLLTDWPGGRSTRPASRPSGARSPCPP